MASPRRCIFVSDLHHFSRRAQQQRYEREVVDAARAADVLVLGGDIFDFKWSTIAGHEATLDAAQRWLVDLIQVNSDCRIAYVLGNHDFDEGLMARLRTLADRYDHFEWHPFFWVAGSTLFLHGDVADRLIVHEVLEKKRNGWKAHRRPHPLRHDLYDVALRLRLHRVPNVVVHQPRMVARRILHYVASHPELAGLTIERVFFGHTHAALDGYRYQGVRFYNGGAPMEGLEFRLIETEL